MDTHIRSTATPFPMPATAGTGRADDIQQMFDGVASRYDLLNRMLSLGMDEYWRHRTTVLAAPRVHGPIIDLCTGTADLAIAFARAHRRLVYGLDFSERMLHYARGKISRRRLAARVRLVRGDALRTPFATGKAAAISIAWGLRNLESIAGGLREMRRLAAPGGRLAVLENSRPDLPLVGSVYDLYFNRLMPRIGRAVTRASHDAYEYLARSTADFPPPERIMALMRDIGLCEIQRHPMMFGAISLYTATAP